MSPTTKNQVEASVAVERCFPRCLSFPRKAKSLSVDYTEPMSSQLNSEGATWRAGNRGTEQGLRSDTPPDFRPFHSNPCSHSFFSSFDYLILFKLDSYLEISCWTWTGRKHVVVTRCLPVPVPSDAPSRTSFAFTSLPRPSLPRRQY